MTEAHPSEANWQSLLVDSLPSDLKTRINQNRILAESLARDVAQAVHLVKDGQPMPDHAPDSAAELAMLIAGWPLLI